VCAVVFEACRRGRELACLKKNTAAVTSVGHLVLDRCSNREAFEDFFNGVEDDKVRMDGIRGLWDKLVARACAPDASGQLPLGVVWITSPIYSVLMLMKDAISIQWTDARVPQDNRFYCAFTGAKLHKGDPCFACNIRTVVVRAGEGAPPPADRDRDGEEPIPTRDVIDNTFMVGHALRETPMGGGAGARPVEPVFLLEALTALLQYDLYLKRAIKEWLDAQRAFLPQGYNALIIANALTSDQGFEKIVEWYTYLYHLCYVIDVALPPRAEPIGRTAAQE